MTLENAWFLLLFIPVIAAAVIVPWLRKKKRDSVPAVRFPSISLLFAAGTTLRARAANWLWVLRVVALGLLVIALARPRRGIETVYDTTRGVDIALCIDVSGSMQERDLARGSTRLEVAQEVAASFIDRREHDRIALVPFAKYAYRMCPLTLQHDWVKQQLARLRIKQDDRVRRARPRANDDEEEAGLIDSSRTAIGTALAVATNALSSSDAKSKVIILLTDGQSNFGKLDPEQAAALARQFGIRIYTIGAGRAQQRRVGMFSLGRVDPIDEDTLREVADVTGGRYFRAQDAQGLKRTYVEIDELERTKVESMRHTRYREQFASFAMPAGILVFIEVLLSWTILRRSP